MSGNTKQNHEHPHNSPGFASAVSWPLQQCNIAIGLGWYSQDGTEVTAQWGRFTYRSSRSGTDLRPAS